MKYQGFNLPSSKESAAKLVVLTLQTRLICLQTHVLRPLQRLQSGLSIQIAVKAIKSNWTGAVTE
jgi:hypothetical protein